MKKLLIVDDEEAMLDIVSKFFVDTDIQVLTSQTPVHALHMFTTENPQVILADLKLGVGMDGVTMCGKMRQRTPKTITIAMSGYVTAYDLNFLRGAGWDEVFAKPLDREILIEAVECAFKRRARWDIIDMGIA